MSAKKKVREFGNFLIQQLAGHSLTADKVGLDFMARQKEMKDFFAEMDSVKELMEKNDGQENWIDLDVYREVKLFQSTLLNRLGYNRKHGIYLRVFPHGFSKFSSSSLEQKYEKLQVMKDELAKKGEAFADLVTLLGNMVDKVKPVVEEKKSLLTKMDSLKGEVESLELEWEKEYRRTFFELSQLFPEEKRVVSAFFKKKDKNVKKKKNTHPVEEPVESAPESENAV